MHQVAFIDLGAEVRDRVTGWSGIAVAYKLCLGGAPFFQVQSRDLDAIKDHGDGRWFEEDRLEYIGPGVALSEPAKQRRLAGFGRKE